ncbi:MAG: cell filamentation protein Fic [Planctomycetota bacterium]|nr:MAG: cell filamentation protein Fic [Planctomycetota bacterium]
MKRRTGIYETTVAGGERVQAFVPYPLPPANPPLVLDERLSSLLADATAALGQLAVAGAMVPSPDWFLYGFVRKEAVISSQIEGTQATLADILEFEATSKARRPDDVEEVCNYVDALHWARRELSRSKGLPISTRFLCLAHGRLMRGVRGANRQPGAIRRSQNWIGGTRPGNARFVPPPPDQVPAALSAFEKWLHKEDQLPPLLRAGLAHVQFETIHPFLDGNGRIGRLLITLLLEHWGLLDAPTLYLSLALKRHQQEYYDRLTAVRTDGDWEGWTAFYLECVREAAQDGVAVAQRLFKLISEDRRRLLAHEGATIPAIRLFDHLPTHPMITLAKAIGLLKTSKPTASKAISALTDTGVLRETTGRQRDRVYAYHAYLRELTRDSD